MPYSPGLPAPSAAPLSNGVLKKGHFHEANEESGMHSPKPGMESGKPETATLSSKPGIHNLTAKRSHLGTARRNPGRDRRHPKSPRRRPANANARSGTQFRDLDRIPSPEIAQGASRSRNATPRTRISSPGPADAEPGERMENPERAPRHQNQRMEKPDGCAATLKVKDETWK